MVKFLLEKNANVNITIKNGETPLQAAAFFGYLDIIKILINEGADINTVVTSGDNTGKTALDAAIEGGIIMKLKRY